MRSLKINLSLLLILIANYAIAQAPCFVVGTADDETSTSGDWTNDGNWNGTSPGCDISTTNRTVEVDVDMTVQDTNCATLTMSGESTALQLVNNSTLIIEGDLDLTGEFVCIYIEAGSTLRVEGDLIINNESAELRVKGILDVVGEITCNGTCQSGSTTFSGSGTTTAGGGCSGDFGGECSSALPIELLSFYARLINSQAVLSWSTASETNNDYYTIQRAISGLSFENIGFVDGAGNSVEILHYKFVDANPISGISYYRLKQTDFDGTFDYSWVSSIENGLETADFKIIPNPALDGKFQLSLPFDNGIVNIRIFDVSGKTTFLKLRIPVENFNELTLPIPELNAGIYIVSVIQNGVSFTQKLLVK